MKKGDMELNKIKVVLADKGMTNKALAESLERNEVTVSRWCRNAQQPHLSDLFHIASILEVDVCELLRKENPYSIEEETTTAES